MTVLGDKILIKPDEAIKQTESGLFIPDQSLETKHSGIVVSCGDDVKGIYPGDRVIYGKFAGDDIEHESQKYKIVRVHEILVRL